MYQFWYIDHLTFELTQKAEYAFLATNFTKYNNIFILVKYVIVSYGVMKLTIFNRIPNKVHVARSECQIQVYDIMSYIYNCIELYF